MIQTDLAAMGLTVLAFLMALIREGALVEVLSRRMSRREKATTTSFLLFALLSAAILDSKRPKDPYRFQEEEVVHGESLPISILYQYPWMESEARSLMDHLERSLGGMIDALEIAELPTTRIAYDSSLDAGIFQTATLTDLDGLLVRANYDEITETQRGDLVAYVMRGVLDTARRSGRCSSPSGGFMTASRGGGCNVASRGISGETRMP